VGDVGSLASLLMGYRRKSRLIGEHSELARKDAESMYDIVFRHKELAVLYHSMTECGHGKNSVSQVEAG
jgi:hypothetical protein